MKKINIPLPFIFLFLIWIGGLSLKSQDRALKNFSSPLDSMIVNFMDEINADSIKNILTQLQSHETRFMLSPNRKQVALWIQDRFESVGCQVTKIDSFQTHTQIVINEIYYDTVTWQYNVSAIMLGATNPDQIIVIGGHYDSFTNNDPMTVAPGADDNGSSVAAIIELARVFNTMDYQPNKTLHFAAWGAEELMYYSSQSGAGDYAEKCVQNNDNLLLYINNDMIANEPENENWIVDLMVHDLDVWTTTLTVDLSLKYTSLESNLMDTGPYGADDLPFWEAGFKTVYFMEHNFSPYYHSEGDIVDHCNMEYCQEITKLNLALLLSVSEKPVPVEQFNFNSLEDGETLEASWIFNDDNDIVEYEINFGTDPENWDETYTTSTSVHLFSGLETGTLYYASISAMNEMGCKSVEVVRKAKPAVVSLDEGILIVAGSEGGLLDPLQEEIDMFYDTLCHNYVHDFYNAANNEEISLDNIGKYSSILWHVDNYESISNSFIEYDYVLRNYLHLGGHVLLTGFRPSFILGAGSYPGSFKAGSFMFDCFHVGGGINEASRLFAGAINDNGVWPSMYVDSVKIPAFNFHLPWIEVFTSSGDGEVIYRYDTKFDTSSVQGSYYNLPVGVATPGSDKQTVILSFPLYYLDYNQAKQFIYQTMTGHFGEEYLNVQERNSDLKNFLIDIYPNPAQDEIKISFSVIDDQPVNIYLMDITGQVVKEDVFIKPANVTHELEWDVSALPSGIYLYQVWINNQRYAGKLILSK